MKTLNTKTEGKLNSLLRIYFDAGSMYGEKTNALGVFEKICKKNNVDPNDFIDQSSANPKNRDKQQTSFGRSRNMNDFSDEFGVFGENAKMKNEKKKQENVKKRTVGSGYL